MTHQEQVVIETFVLRQANATPIDAILGHDIFDKVTGQRLGPHERAYFIALAEDEARALRTAQRVEGLSIGTQHKIGRLLKNAEDTVAIFRKTLDAR